jgi:hypothetical protein
MKNKIDYTARLWDRAEECRALADLTTEPQLKAEYLKLANSYLRLAEREEGRQEAAAQMIRRATLQQTEIEATG